jgi:two-component system LytT family response regulator
MPISSILVDDEPLARQRLRSLLSEYEDIAIAGEASDCGSAVRLVREVRPRLMFLDVQMPGDDGFEVVRRLGVAERPLVVFVTAYEQYAFHAFRASAVQYLLKPVDRGELRNALGRVREIASNNDERDASAAVTALLRDFQNAKRAAEKVVVRSKDRVLVFDLDQIDWMEAAGNYVRIHVGQERFLVRESMRELEERLDPRRFVRIHRSSIVNVDRIREFRAASHGDHEVFLRNGTALTLSRVYRDRFEFVLGRL